MRQKTSSPIANVNPVMPRDRGVMQVIETIRTPGWEHIQHYLRYLRNVAAKECLRLSPVANAWELSKRQGEIRIIDEILTHTDEESLMLGKKVSDFVGTPVVGPFKMP